MFLPKENRGLPYFSLFFDVLSILCFSGWLLISVLSFKLAGTIFQVRGPAGTIHTAGIMFSDLYVTKRSGFQMLQGNHVDPAAAAGWSAC